MQKSIATRRMTYWCVMRTNDEIIKSYPTTVEADLSRLELEAAGIPSIVVGISAGMEGGVAGVQLLVQDDQVQAALTLLRDA